MTGTCTLGRIVNVIKESELDRLSTSWVMVRASHLLSRWSTVVVDSGAAGGGPVEEGVATRKSSQSSEIDELIFMRENMRLGPFQTQANEEPLCEHVHLENEAQVQAVKLAPMHVVDGGEAKLAACRKWLQTRRDTPPHKRNALLKKYVGSQADMEEGHAFFCMQNSLVLSKELLYVSTMPKGKVEGVLTFLVPTDQCRMALNGVHCDIGHQGQQRMLALAQECFWWPMLVDDCRALVWGCQQCCTFEGVVPKAPLCPIWAHALLELVHVDFTSVESTMELNKPPSVKNVLVITDRFTHYAMAVITKDQTAKTVVKVLYERFIGIFGMPAKLLSDHGANFTSALVEELCAMFGIHKCQTTAYHMQCNGQVEWFHQMLFRMIGKLAADKNVQWEQYLPELLQAYNSARSAYILKVQLWIQQL